uniref:Uncharacterized protein n=1 Tax=Panagrellus redivivus TaxID=6233 RepID=A0A7E4V4U1_PANRE
MENGESDSDSSVCRSLAWKLGRRLQRHRRHDRQCRRREAQSKSAKNVVDNQQRSAQYPVFTPTAPPRRLTTHFTGGAPVRKSSTNVQHCPMTIPFSIVCALISNRRQTPLRSRDRVIGRFSPNRANSPAISALFVPTADMLHQTRLCRCYQTSIGDSDLPTP